MTNYKYLIIGGGAAGTSAAETIRLNDKIGSITIISDEPYPLYSRVMLSKPNFFLGKIPFDRIYMKGKEWYSENNIDFLGGKKVVRLNPATKTLSLSDDSELQYEKLLIATGVDARKWTVKGAEKNGIHYLRTLEDGKGIMEAIKIKTESFEAITIGGGFISFEMADMLNMAGLKTTSIIIDSYFWEPILDEPSGMMLERAMAKAGVKIMKNSEVTEVLGKENVDGVTVSRKDTGTESSTLPCKIIVCGIGTTNPIQWLNESNAGIAVNRGILANEFMETSVSDIWTAGDIAEYKDLILEENIEMGNWVNAIEQGRIAGLNMVVSAIQNASSSVSSPLLATGSSTNPSIDSTSPISPIQKQAFKFVSFYTTQGFGVNVAFVGDVNAGKSLRGRTIIPRGSPEIDSYARLIIAENGELVGATLINRTNEMNTIAKLIEKNVKVVEKQKELADVNFDLKTLLA